MQHLGPLCTSNKLTQFVRLVLGFVEADADSDKLSQLTCLTLPLPKMPFARTEQVSLNIKFFNQRKKHFTQPLLPQSKLFSMCRTSFLPAWLFGFSGMKREQTVTTICHISHSVMFLILREVIKKILMCTTFTSTVTLNLTGPQLTLYHRQYHSPSNMKTNIFGTLSVIWNS